MAPKKIEPLSDLPEEELIRRFQERSGDVSDRAFEELVTRLTPWLYRVVRSRGLPAEDSQEAVAEVWIRVWTRWRQYRCSFEQAEAFRTWVYTIARSLLTDLHRKMSLELPSEEKPAILHLLESEESVEAEDILESYLSLLEPEERRVLDLVSKGYSFEEIADMLKVSPSRLRHQYHRAGRELRKALEDM